MTSVTWHLNPFLSIDTETTGVDPFSDRIVEVAAVDVMPDDVLVNGWSTIVDPGVEIPAEAAAVHHITTTRAATEGVAPEVALTALAERIFEHWDTWRGNAAVVIYNATFDWPLLLVEAERYGIEFPPFAAILDPLLIDRMVDRYRAGGRKLVQVAAHYGVILDEHDAHGGLADATASGLIMRRLCDKYPAIVDRSLSSLWLRQVRGHEGWRGGFEEYLRKKVNPDAVIDSGWPIPAKAAS